VFHEVALIMKKTTVLQ